MAKPIHVLHVIDKLTMDGVNPSSPAILLKDWIPHLKKNGIESSVLSLKPFDPAGDWLKNQGVEVNLLGHGKFSWKNVAGIKKVIETVGAQIIHLHGYSSANFGRIAARQCGIKCIVHEHAVLPILPHQFLADLFLRHHTDAAVAVSGNVRNFMIRGRWIPHEKIRVIGNGIRVADYQKKDQSYIIEKRKEIGIPEGHHVVGTVARLRKEKGVEFVIRSIPAVVEVCSNVMFVIVGEGELRAHLENLAKTLQVSTHVVFLGFRADVPALLSLCDVNVIPSLTEGFPLSLVEAMAAGNAIVASDVGGMREIAKHGETLLFVPPQDPKQLSESILHLLTDIDVATRLSQAAQQHSVRFDIDSSTDSLSKLYEDLVGDSSSSN